MNDLATQKPIPAVLPEVSLWRWLTEPHEAQWLLPATGAWILGLDWFLFSQETVTLFVATPLTAIVGFLGGALGTYFFQSRYAGERGTECVAQSDPSGPRRRHSRSARWLIRRRLDSVQLRPGECPRTIASQEIAAGS